MDKELHSLPVVLRVRFLRIYELTESTALERMSGPHFKHLTGLLWEIGVNGRSGIARAVYVSSKGIRGVAVSVIVKKTVSTP
ncbi:MAG: type II toxin-antitoxin system RelE/ParE family toxin [Acidobacteriota bacterium]|nr:type II toxin-antitoxin system RelE/ParE family toxin [Acidobacteriota bacterium]